MSDPQSTSCTPRSTPSATFERILAAGNLPRRERQDRAVTLAHKAVQHGERVIIQAPTGVGKSYVALSTAADAGKPGAPGIVVATMNNLGDQYVADCRRASELSGFSYTRVMGASHYVCADSMAAMNQGVPGYDSVNSDDDAARVKGEREEWLAGSVKPGSDPATMYELRAQGRDDTWACPGYPECSGGKLGGCGSKAARRRSFEVAVVISNFHMLAYTHKLGLPLLPLSDAAVVVVDEAHELAEKIAEIDGGKINERTGSRAFAKYPQLAAAAEAWIRQSLDRTVWGESEWDTEAGVPVDMDGMSAFVNAYKALTDEQREAIGSDTKQDDGGQFGAGDVLSLLRNFAEAGMNVRTWRAWTTRRIERRGTRGQPHTWVYSRTVQLRRVNAAAEVVPALLPKAAVLLTGTVGQTMPARVGLDSSEVVDLGQEFDWSKVQGRISRHSGIKSRISWQERKARDEVRTNELADAIRNHGGALVLANAHADAVAIAGLLDQNLRGHMVFLQEAGGGSLAAERIRQEFVQHRERGGKGVLVGTDSFATGLDLPGDLCTFVSWWTCVKQVSGYFDKQITAFYAAHGHYEDERFRARFAQGVGRLLRSPSDTGELMICDARAVNHVRYGLGRVDQHIASISWTAGGAA